MVDLAALHGVAEGPHDRLLADDIGEGAWPVPTVQRPLLLLWLLLDRHRSAESIHARSGGREDSGGGPSG